MKIGKVELTKEKLIAAIAAAVALVALGAYLIFYAPVIRETGIKYAACRAVENELLECRNIIESAGRIQGKRVLMTEKDVSHAIDELTRQGKLEGINFVSMSPGEIKEEEGSQYKTLPINVEIKSTYKQLGIFLGSLDKLEKGLVKVKSFDITANAGDPKLLTTVLVMDMYLSGREDER